jgi:nicotinamidase-related amidase
VTQYFIERIKETVISNIARLLDFFRAHDLPVYFAKLASMHPDRKDYSRNYRDFNILSEQLIEEPAFPYKQDPETSIIPELKTMGNDVIFIKTTSGSFTSTDLDHQLRNLGLDTVIVVGVVTNFCVETTARSASDLGFQIIVIDDACAAWTPSLHETSLRVLELRYATVFKTEEILKKLRKKS